jgi:molecular chaperone DnaK (HSP70)
MGLFDELKKTISKEPAKQPAQDPASLDQIAPEPGASSQDEDSDLNNAIASWVAEEFKSESKIDLTEQADAMERIKEEVKNAKIALASSGSYIIELPFITADHTGPKHLKVGLSGAKLKELHGDFLKSKTTQTET